MSDEADRWSVLEVLQWTAGAFKSAGIDSPRLTAEVLLGHALSCSRLDLYLNYDRPLTPAERAGYRELIRRRLDRCPTAYLTGRREFWKIELAVGPGVLVPRPETEGLVEAALGHLAAGDRVGPLLLDLGTGSGAVALALAAEIPTARVTALDLSIEALGWARRSAAGLGLTGRVDLVAGDLFAPLAPGVRFDVITANPPYVSEGEWAGLAPEIRRYEPRRALVAGPTGLEIISRLAAEAPPFLAPGGAVLCEIGAGQAEAARELFGEYFGRVSALADLRDVPRVVKAEAPLVKGEPGG
ncbi:MAG: peptide chain release factor N(5)-glutamine methyltransferase [Proteobacteria bacterium]|nr:peptide chain release factor N(5)-glutamine methyltransferase [Pseudomonadota bacterium]MBU1741098.1 peptide chain release factor N(5)-glutamine methyltransferase [Pseudomonadota bacterium]